MEREIRQAEEVLKSIRAISADQIRQIENKRIEELLASQAERDQLFEELRKIRPECLKDGSLKAVADEIKANDKVIYMNMEALMGTIKGKLKNLKKGARAVRAYSKNAS